MSDDLHSIALSAPGFRLRARSYLALCKLRIVALIVFTALIGMLLAVPGWPPIGLVLAATLGVALASASAAAINHVIDHHIDERMRRTCFRPLPLGALSERKALAFAAVLGVASMAVLTLAVNTLTAVLTFGGLIGYAVIYTALLKHLTPQNIVLGGAAGAVPPIIGWAAMTGTVSPTACALFLIVFVWTPPHFWPLAIARRDDYARAGVPMLPVTHGVAFTRLHVLFYTILLVPITLLPWMIGTSGWLYFAAALLLGANFLRHAVVLWRGRDPNAAMATFGYSIWYLTALFAALLVDHYLLLFIAGA
ncbi:MAG: heme o synthase [Gammaproteobacteria bacterium]|nr:heme o synthase [Gammaproteobacteria bacterium]